jgi:hypothetical protein
MEPMEREAVADGPKRAAKFAVVATSVLVGLLICEIALRVVGYTYPVFYEPDQQRGYRLRPGMEGIYRKEGRAFVRINSEGLRDREHQKQKPPGVFRIAVVGDSYAEALQVEQQEAFWSVMERRLAGLCAPSAGLSVEVVNFGVSGYGTAQELITLREQVWAYSPDMVLLAVTTNNDVTDNARALKRTDEVPYFVLRDGQLILDDSFRETRAFRLRSSGLNRVGRWLRDHLRFTQAIHEAHGAIKSAISARRSQGKREETDGREGPAPPAEVGIENMIYGEPPDQTWRDAWAVTEALVTQMHAEVRARGARFLVVTLSNPMQVHPDAAARERFLRWSGGTDLFYADLRFKALGERAGFAVYNLAPDLRRYAEERRVFLHGFGPRLGDGHWNQAGHAAAGELLAQRLCPDIASATHNP